ncbi:MAG TPA: MFS transporter [Hyphomicrobiaceae bacterium]|nr:MFS transporter [Hyphomicrobiaceae bacterium]
MRSLSGRSLVVAMCIGQVGNLLPHVVVPAVMAQHLIPQWQLSASEAGLMASSFAVGYMLAVPVLATLTDRVDARIVLLVGSAVSGLATLAFGLLAQGLVSAIVIWGLAGVGFAGAYMPGLKALTDRLGSGDISRSVTLYTASFSFGVGLSFLLAQLTADHFGWRAAFYLTALGPLAMIAASLGMAPVTPKASSRPLLDFKPVFRNRTALGYILGYGAHCFELYALRTWIVTFWAYVTARNGGSATLEPITVSVIAAVVAMPASIIGNEAAIRFGRHRAIIWFMCIAGAAAVLIGLATEASPSVLLPLMLIYTLAIPADSGALTSGMSASAVPEYRGATMALHSTVGFGLSAAGGWAVGVAIDAGGGMTSPSGWLAAFLVMAAAGLLGPAALWWSRQEARP